MSNKNIEIDGVKYMPVIDIDSVEMECQMETIDAVVSAFKDETKYALLNELALSDDKEIRGQVDYFLTEFIGEFDDQTHYIEHVLMNVLVGIACIKQNRLTNKFGS